ncbi:MAG: hypothetical protein V1663_02560 [archaeon]
MPKMGKVNTKSVKEDKEKRGSGRGNFGKFHTYETGTNFTRMLPPMEGREVPWEHQKRHFSLGPSMKGFSPCTETGKDCFACKMVRKDSNSADKKVRALAEKRKQSSANIFQMMDVTPLYTKKKKKGKTTFVPDNPPPKCWGSIEVDEDGDPIGKCQRCTWNKSCSEGVTKAALSGQRIDDLCDYFDKDIDLTDLKTGRNIKVVKKGKTFGDISYSVEAGEELAWEIPKHMRNFIKKNFIDLVEATKHATPEETEDAWKGRSSSDDLPECFGEFNSKKKKCKKCEYNDVCSEEKDSGDNDDDDKKKKKESKKVKTKDKKKKDEADNNDDNNDDDDDDNNGNSDDDNNDDDDDNNDDDDNDDDDNDDDDNDDDDNNDDDDDDNNDDDDNDDDNNKKKGKELKKKLKEKSSKKPKKK